MTDAEKLRQQFALIEGGKPLQNIRDVSPLPSCGGGGTYDGMEPRVAKLEAGVAHLERDVGELRVDMRDVRDRLARLETKVDHLPSKGFSVTALLSVLAVMSALILFGEQIKAYVASPPVAATQPAASP